MKILLCILIIVLGCAAIICLKEIAKYNKQGSYEDK